MQYWQSGLNLQKTHYSLSLINHVYYYHPLFSMDVLTNTWTGNLVKVVIPRPDPSGAPVAGVGKVSCQLFTHSIWLLSWLQSWFMNLCRAAGVFGICRCGGFDQSEDGHAREEVWREPGGGCVLPRGQVRRRAVRWMKLETNARVGVMATRCTVFFFITVFEDQNHSNWFRTIL